MQTFLLSSQFLLVAYRILTKKEVTFDKKKIIMGVEAYWKDFFFTVKLKTWLVLKIFKKMYYFQLVLRRIVVFKTDILQIKRCF